MFDLVRIAVQQLILYPNQIVNMQLLRRVFSLESRLIQKHGGAASLLRILESMQLNILFPFAILLLRKRFAHQASV